MSEVNRRNVVKFAAVSALWPRMAICGRASGEEPNTLSELPRAQEPKDAPLANAIRSPQSFILSDAEVFRLEGDGRSRDLIITSAINEEGKRLHVHVPSGSIRIFRADADVDEFTGQGGLYWRFQDKPGKTKLSRSGEIMMVMREGYDTVRCYVMTIDLRC
jgi:hypothetical protein